MVDTLKKVKSGDPLRIPAATFNAMIDAARDHQQRRQGREQTSFPAFRQSGIVLARNDSGSDRDRFDGLGIDAVDAPLRDLQEPRIQSRQRLPRNA